MTNGGFLQGDAVSFAVESEEILPLGLQWLFYQDFNEQFAAKVQKKWEICKFTRNYFDISEKSTTFAATNLKDIHNKDYSVV